MGELEDSSGRKICDASRPTSPAVSKLARSDGDDSGVEDEDHNAPNVLQEKLAAVLMTQLQRFEQQMSHHVVAMREQDQLARQHDRQQNQEQIHQLEAVQLRQSQTLSLVAERVESGRKNLTAQLEENQGHIRKCIEKITLEHTRINSLGKDGWRPDPWKQSTSTRERPDKVEGSVPQPTWDSHARVKREVYPPPKKGDWSKLPESDPEDMSFPSPGLTEDTPGSRKEETWPPRVTPTHPVLPDPAHVLPSNPATMCVFVEPT